MGGILPCVSWSTDVMEKSWESPQFEGSEFIATVKKDSNSSVHIKIFKSIFLSLSRAEYRREDINMFLAYNMPKNGSPE